MDGIEGGVGGEIHCWSAAATGVLTSGVEGEHSVSRGAMPGQTVRVGAHWQHRRILRAVDIRE